MSRLFHISFGFPGVPKVRDLELPFSGLGDWVRINSTTWVLWSAYDQSRLIAGLNASLDSADQYLITEVAPNTAVGRLPEWVWQWINTKRAGSVLLPPPRSIF